MQPSKSDIRQFMQAQCKALPQYIRDNAAEQALISALDLLVSAHKVAVYHAYQWELNLAPLIEYCLAQNKHLYLPVAYKDSKNMHFAKYTIKESMSVISASDYIPKDVIEWYNLDLIFVPLLAVDKRGWRLGKGGGYYDTTLVKSGTVESQTVLCGVGFALQLVDTVPHDVWDVPLDYFLSERGLIKFADSL